MDTHGYATLVEEWGPTIDAVARQVAREFRYGDGYEVVSADDIRQSVYEQFFRSGIGGDGLDAMDEPVGFIRSTARLYGAANEAKSRRRSVQVDLSDDWRPDPAGSPEDEVISAETVAAVEAAALTILDGVSAPLARQVARLFYFEGIDGRRIADRLGTTAIGARKALQRAREAIGPEADASLRAWRRFAFPEAKRPPSIDARPVALVSLLGESHSVRAASLTPQGRS